MPEGPSFLKLSRGSYVGLAVTIAFAVVVVVLSLAAINYARQKSRLVAKATGAPGASNTNTPPALRGLSN